MGADNWRQCPKCQAKYQAARELHDAAVKAAYGTIPAVDYEALKMRTPDVPEETLDEYFEIGVYLPSSFDVNYDCACQKCGFKFAFTHTEQVALG